MQEQRKGAQCSRYSKKPFLRHRDVGGTYGILDKNWLGFTYEY